MGYNVVGYNQFGYNVVYAVAPAGVTSKVVHRVEGDTSVVHR